MTRYLFAFILFSLSFSVHGTTFYPLSIDKQLEESDAVLRGIHLGSTVKRINNKIFTEHSFKIVSSSGIAQGSIYNRNDFKVYSLGGSYAGLTRFIEGSPKFKKDGESILVLKKAPYGYIVNNLSLGQYEIFWENNRQYLKSKIFPTHPKLGQISLQYFDGLVDEIIGEKLKKPLLDKYIHQKKVSNYKGNKNRKDRRAPAGSNKNKSSNENDESGLFWPMVIFAILGGWATIHARSYE